MHAAARKWLQRQGHTRPGCGLDIGGRDVNGTARGFFPAIEWEGVDLHPGPGVDHVADAADWTPPRRYDLVLCTEVLEHTPTWGALIATAHRALAPGGTLLVTCAGPDRPPHHYNGGGPPRSGEWYRNITPQDLTAVIGANGLKGTVKSTGRDLYCAAVKP